MQFRFADLPRVKLPGKLYSLELYIEPSDADIKALRNALTYEQRKEPHISWFVADSDTDSSTAVKTTAKAGVKAGVKGRPKTVVYGKKTVRHAHVGIVGSEGCSAYSTARRVGVSMNKRLGGSKTRVIAMDGAGFIPYCYKQVNRFYTGGNFDFLQCKDDFFIED